MTFRVAIAGAGFGANVHLPAFRALPGVEVAAIAASTEARGREAAERLQLPWGGSIGQLCERAWDGIVVALPPTAGEAAVAAALRRPGAILAEKPLARSPEQADIFAGAAAGRTATVDFEFMELDTFARLKRLIDDEALGRIQEAELTWLTFSRTRRDASLSWKTEAGHGGILPLLGTHAVFLAEWLLGPLGPIEHARLTAAAALAPHAVAFAAPIAATGGAFKARIDNACDEGPLHRWRIVGTRGEAVIENGTIDYMSGFCLRAPGVALDEAAGREDGRIRAVGRLAQRFVAAAREGTACFPDFAAAARVQCVLAEIERCASSS
jgi:predicted dehydrogenase